MLLPLLWFPKFPYSILKQLKIGINQVFPLGASVKLRVIPSTFISFCLVAIDIDLGTS